MKVVNADVKQFITNEHLKNGGDILASYLCCLFNEILTTEYTPKNFRLGMIISIYKGKNSKSDPRHYRGITLTSCLSKLFEKILLERILKYIDKTQQIFPDPLQFGFRQEHGAIMSVYSLLEVAQFYTERNSYVFAAFLDNEKAFDRIWHNGLFYKLHELGIRGNILRLIINSYSNSFSFVRYEGEKSDIFPVKQGIGQGRVMSSWFFLVYINDLITSLNSKMWSIEIW